MRAFTALLALALLAGCATAPAEWVDKPGYRVASIKIAERYDLNSACGQSADWSGNGCAYRDTDTATVYVRPGLSQMEYERVMTHEIVFHIIEGKNHDSTPRYRLSN